MSRNKESRFKDSVTQLTRFNNCYDGLNQRMKQGMPYMCFSYQSGKNRMVVGVAVRITEAGNASLKNVYVRETMGNTMEEAVPYLPEKPRSVQTLKLIPITKKQYKQITGVDLDK